MCAFMYLSTCMCVCVCRRWRWLDNFQELVPSFHHACPRNQTQVTRLGSKRLLPVKPSCLPNPISPSRLARWPGLHQSPPARYGLAATWPASHMGSGDPNSSLCRRTLYLSSLLPQPLPWLGDSALPGSVATVDTGTFDVHYMFPLGLGLR